jgi:hypothetical protein
MHKTRSTARMIPYQSSPIFATFRCRAMLIFPRPWPIGSHSPHHGAIGRPFCPRTDHPKCGGRNHAARRVFVLRYSPSGAPDMARKYSKGASKKVARAMKKRKKGTLKSGRSGKKVKSRKQAIAIGLSEARKEGKKVPKKKSSKKKSAKKSASSSRKTSATRKKKTTKKRSKKSRS